jgi:hypothetical protein
LSHKFSRPKETLSKLDAYKIALETRNLEIGLFWQRSNYFLVLNVALALGFFKVENNILYSTALSVFGAIISILWLRVNLGSKFWQSRWEERLKIQESILAPNLNFFAAEDQIINDDVKRNILENKPRKRWFKKAMDEGIMKRHSVSYNMILLSVLFIIGWSVLFYITFFISKI